MGCLPACYGKIQKNQIPKECHFTADKEPSPDRRVGPAPPSPYLIDTHSVMIADIFSPGESKVTAEMLLAAGCMIPVPVVVRWRASGGHLAPRLGGTFGTKKRLSLKGSDFPDGEDYSNPPPHSPRGTCSATDPNWRDC
ncbi:hypothetical protein N1851_008286 [Merluccius polli]|uniref:Uncharacterized protein n=1 Tax=Merluccius polli TaxID=89951 RepID=A0AA47N2U0_MERPO|nr:hypothetical protein N1851_008286 [Merluccius polli]